MEFKSQICTTKEQSEKLLALGLKKETADMYYSENPRLLFIRDKGIPLVEEDFPAWSLHRLLEMLYEDLEECMIFFPNPYEEIIADIERVIEQGYFNKDYLEEKQ